MYELIKEKIKQSPQGKISFAEYMELALYHPTKGYYMNEKEKIGKKGDFITTSNISNIFGAMVAKWFLRQVENNGIQPVICEIGAGNGRFAKAFLDTWKEQTGIPLQYFIVETSPYHRKLQMELLPIGENVIQVNSLSDLNPFNGMIFSNELFDALPVHVIEKRNGNLYEVMVGIGEHGFNEQLVLLENEKIIAFLEKQEITLSNDQRLEIPLMMESVLKEISHTLQSGIVVTIDYGYTKEEWKNPARKNGSLRGYYNHQMVTDVLSYPGLMDLTTHIHFDSLIEMGESLGLQYLTKKRQDEFLLEAGILKELEDHYDPNPFSERSKRNRAIRSLIMPGMSSQFHVILQKKKLQISLADVFT